MKVKELREALDKCIDTDKVVVMIHGTMYEITDLDGGMDADVLVLTLSGGEPGED